MPQISDVADELRLDVPGAPMPLVERELREAAREFCDKSLAWRYVGDKAAVTAGQETIDPDLPTESELILVDWLAIDGTRIAPTSAADVPPSLADTGPVTAFRVEGDEIVPMPVPDADATAQVGVIVRPSSTARSIDDALWGHWSDGIKSRAIARLCLMHGRTWSNPDLGGYHQQRFAAVVERAKNRGRRGGAIRSMQIRQRPMA